MPFHIFWNLTCDDNNGKKRLNELLEIVDCRNSTIQFLDI